MMSTAVPRSPAARTQYPARSNISFKTERTTGAECRSKIVLLFSTTVLLIQTLSALTNRFWPVQVLPRYRRWLTRHSFPGYLLPHDSGCHPLALALQDGLRVDAREKV